MTILEIKRFYKLTAALCAFCLMEAIAISAAPGDLDLTFGNSGIIRSFFVTEPYYEYPHSAKVQTDGKVVVCGEILDFDDAANSYVVSSFLARFQPNGMPDTSFGINGKILAPFNSDEVLDGGVIALQPDGKLIAAGTRGLARYNADGILDLSFGTAGRVATPYMGPAAVELQLDGKIVIAGWGSTDLVSGLTVARYNTDGSPDPGFGRDGVVAIRIDDGYPYFWVRTIIIRSDGKILVGGNSIDSALPPRLGLAQFNSNGSLDRSFGTSGIANPTFPNTDIEFSNGVFQPDGAILVVGYVLADPVVMAVIRLDRDGGVDPTFASNGVFQSRDRAVSFDAAIALQTNGKILTFSGLGLAQRLNADGTPDLSFGSGGVVRGGWFNVTTGALQADGRSLLLGWGNGLHEFSIARLIGDPVAPGPVAISGRVMSPSGQGLRNAIVELTDQLGSVHTALTSSFGYYSFSNITGGIYTVSVRSRRYQFTARTLTITDNLADVDLIGVQPNQEER